MLIVRTSDVESVPKACKFFWSLQVYHHPNNGIATRIPLTVSNVEIAAHTLLATATASVYHQPFYRANRSNVHIG